MSTLNMEEDRKIDTEIVGDIIAHFEGKLVSPEVLTEYCNLKHYPPITMGEYEDYLFQYQHDARMAKIVPDIMSVLSNVKVAGMFDSDKSKETTNSDNMALAVEICNLLEIHNIEYREVDLITKNLSSLISAIFKSVDVRVGNMASTVLAETATAKFGEPLTIQKLGAAFRETHPLK